MSLYRLCGLYILYFSLVLSSESEKTPGHFSVSHSLTYQVLPWVCQSPVKIILSLRTFSDMGQKNFRNRIENKLGPKLILSRFLSAEAVSILKRSRRCCWSETWSDIFWQKFWPEKFNRWRFQVCSIDLTQKCYGLNSFLRKKRLIAHLKISLFGLRVVPALKLWIFDSSNFYSSELLWGVTSPLFSSQSQARANTKLSLSLLRAWTHLGFTIIIINYNFFVQFLTPTFRLNPLSLGWA